jgi:6-phosphogluconolactonase
MSDGPSPAGGAHREVVVHATPDLLAATTAARLVTHLVDAQAARGTASFVATGGGMGSAVLAAVAASPARDAVDWSRVDVWWGDERFLPAGDPERNETQARAALLDSVPLDPARVHVMAASDGPDGDDPDAAAAAYAAELATAARASGAGWAGGGVVAVPAFDVVLLGVGPDAHVASLFPGHPGATETEPAAIAVRESPKPPPVRVSLTFPAINTGREVWLVASGEGKAEAVAAALAESAPARVPASGVRGTERTRWLLDAAAAAKLPHQG